MTDAVFDPIAGSPPTIEWVPLTEIKIDWSYQRSVESNASQRLIDHIAQHWDWRLYDPIRLSRRDDGLYVIDGQHRVAGARRRGDLPHLPAIIGRFSGLVEEARLFVAVNTSRRSPNTLDKFRARCAAGDATAIAICNIIEGVGLTVGRTTTKVREREICCVGLVERLHRQHGPAVLTKALGAMASAFGKEGLRIADEMLPGLCSLLQMPPRPVAMLVLVQALSGKSQIDWMQAGWKYRGQNPDTIWPTDVFVALLGNAYRATEQSNWTGAAPTAVNRPVEPPAPLAQPKADATPAPRPPQPPQAPTTPASPFKHGPLPAAPARPASAQTKPAPALPSADAAAIAKFLAEKGATKVPDSRTMAATDPAGGIQYDRNKRKFTRAPIDPGAKPSFNRN